MRRYCAAVLSGDADDFEAGWAEDAEWVVPGGTVIAGREKIWLPARWRARTLATDGRFVTTLMRAIRRLERLEPSAGHCGGLCRAGHVDGGGAGVGSGVVRTSRRVSSVVTSSSVVIAGPAALTTTADRSTVTGVTPVL